MKKTDFKNLIKDIGKRKFWVGSAPGLFQNCYPWIGFINLRRYFGFGFKVVILAFKNNFVWQFLDEEENYLITKRIVEMFIKKTIFKIFEIWQKFREKLIEGIERLGKINLKKISDRELISEYLSFMKSFTDEWTIPLVMEGTAIYTERKLFPEFKEKLKGFNDKTVAEYFALLTQPEKLSFIGRERLNFLKLCLEILRDKKLFKFLKRKIEISKIKTLFPIFYNQLSKHQKKFYWVKINYLKTKPLTIPGFLSLLREEIKNKTEKEIIKEYRNLSNYKKNIQAKKRKILAKIKIPLKLKKELEAISFFTAYFDERKEMALRGSYYMAKLLKELARRTKIDYLTLDYALPEEMPKIFLGNKKKLMKLLVQRRKKSVFIYRFKTKPQIFSGKRAETLWRILFKKEKMGIKTIEGITVCRGGKDYVEGKVRVVLNPFKDVFRGKEILVTTMTRPEFVPLVKKAIAVITDEGGMTCHAAIVSRELNIPCIVGTKKATKILKNGDKVRLRLNHGKVEKI
jgi:phosphohistidine swiveling domain-containing protein